MVKPINSSEGYVKLKKIFPYIMTWNEELVDGDRIFKRIIPYYIERKPGNIPFCNRKLITNISGNKSSKNSKELYSERERAITFFEKNYSRQFDLYGTGWDVKEHPSYKGTPENKYEIYHKYKFALALENTKDVTGYVTEKIYDCLVAGTVPIYEGAKDIIKHVPQECFIDYSRFVSLQELADYLTGMTESEYYNFQRSIENFLDSGIETSLGGAAYAQNIYFVINKNTQSNFRIAKFRRAIIGVYILRKNLFENIKIFLKNHINLLLKENKGYFMIRKLNYIFNKRDKVRIIILLFMIIIGSFLELTGVAAFMPFIEIVMSPSNIQENIWLSKIYTTLNLTSTDMFLAIMALGISAIYIVKNIYLIIMQNCILKFSYRTRKNIAVRLLKTYMEEPYTFHLNKNVAELQRSLQIDTNQFMLLVNNSLQMMAEITVCIVLGLYLFNTSHSITGIVLALLVICVGFFFYVSKKVTLRLGLQNQRYNAKLIQWVDQSLGGIKEVKILQREDFFVSSYEKNYEKLIWGARINELLSAMPRHIVEAVCITGLLGAIVVKMFWGYAGNEVSDFIPQLAVCAVGAFRLLPAVGKMNAYANSIMYCKPSLDLVYNDLQQIRNHKECGVYRHQDDTKWTFKEGIKLINITYKYPDAEQAVLTKINLEIPKGSTVAFIGTSGAGKTTLADIILGLLPPEEGKVLVDNKDIYSNLQCWYNHLGYIPQTIYLSDDTIRNNIAFGIKEEEIIDESVWTALKKAQLVDFVDKLDNGLDTFVGERGMRLSGGQRQRIGIARALYHNPDILILDEATSALDNDTEQAVMDSIESLKREKTILIIAHRLTTIRNADIIYEIADGLAVRKSKDEIFGE